MSDIYRLLRRSQPGSSGAVMAHIRRGEHIAELITERFGVAHPAQWQAKHVRWVLEHGLAYLSPSGRYDYFRTVRVIAAVLGHWQGWQPYLTGPWCWPDGVVKAHAHAGGRHVRLPACANSASAMPRAQCRRAGASRGIKSRWRRHLG